MKNRTACLLAAAALATPCVVLAQAAPAAGEQRTLQQVQRQLQQFQLENKPAVTEMPTGERIFFDYGAYITPSYLSVDDQNNDNHGLREYDFFPWAHLNLDNVHDFYIRGRMFYQDWNPGDSFNNEPDSLQGQLEEAYYKFDLGQYNALYKNSQSDNRASITAGQFYTQWANGLVLTQYMEGARVDVGTGPFDLEFLTAVTTNYTVDFSTDRPNFDTDTRRGFYGALASAQVGKQRPYVYAIAQRDYNPDDELSIGIITTKYDYNSYYIGGGMNGSLSDNLLYKSEICFEGGTSISNSFQQGTFEPVPQTHDTIQAGAADFQLDYLLHDSHKTRLSAETIFATGDPDRLNSSNTFGGNRPHTLDQSFNAWGYLNTGYAFAPQVSNLMTFRIGVSTYPLPDSTWLKGLQVAPNLIVFGKLRSDAPIDEPTTDDHYLGFEPDIALNWQITEDVFFTARYGVFIPGTAEPSHDARQFIYVAVTYAF